jgi:hypothetical protein
MNQTDESEQPLAGGGAVSPARGARRDGHRALVQRPGLMPSRNAPALCMRSGDQCQALFHIMSYDDGVPFDSTPNLTSLPVQALPQPMVLDTERQPAIAATARSPDCGVGRDCLSEQHVPKRNVAG